MSNGPERRASPRRQTDLAVRLTIGGDVRAGRLMSLSRMGGLVVLDQAVSVGTPVALELEPDGRSAVTVRAQVVRVEPSADVQSVGLLFAPLAPAALAVIEALIAPG